MLSAHHLTVQVKKTTLLEDISLNVVPEQIIAVIGSNGAGKSTLLHTLAGNIPTTTGQIVLNGQLLAHWSLQQRARLRAVLSQSISLTFPFAVLEVVLMGREAISATISEQQIQLAHDILQQVGIVHLAQRDYTTLSGGEKQQVQFARILAQIWEITPSQSRYLLLDEPTASLDLAHQHALLNMLQRIAHTQKLGIFIILHDINLAAQYADQVVCLVQGKVVAVGKPNDILTTELIHKVFAVRTTTLMLNHTVFFAVQP